MLLAFLEFIRKLKSNNCLQKLFRTQDQHKQHHQQILLKVTDKLVSQLLIVAQANHKVKVQVQVHRVQPQPDRVQPQQSWLFSAGLSVPEIR